MIDSADLLTTQKRLNEWGRWCYHVTTMGLKFSHRSLVAKLREEGSVALQDTVKILAPANPAAEEVDVLIEQMGEQKPQGAGKPEWAKIIRIHYTMQDKDIAERIQSALLGKTAYYRYLRDGQEWLSQHLMTH